MPTKSPEESISSLKLTKRGTLGPTSEGKRLVNRGTGAAVLVVGVCVAGCGSGDNSAVRAFYPTVTQGALLPQAIADAEKAQA